MVVHLSPSLPLVFARSAQARWQLTLALCSSSQHWPVALQLPGRPPGVVGGEVVVVGGSYHGGAPGRGFLVV